MVVIRKNTIFILLTVFLLVINLKAQDKFMPGFIITNDSDTISGLLKNSSQIKNATECWFKISGNSGANLYLPTDIRAYRFVNGNYYISKRILYNNKYQNIFLQYLVEGNADLFFLKDNDTEHYFLEKSDTIKELLNTEVETYIDGTCYLLYKNEYSGILTIMFSDCMEIQEEISRSKFNHKNLVSIVKDYHNFMCKDEKCIVYEWDNSIKTSMSFLAGLGISTIDFNSKEMYFDFLEAIQFTPKQNFETGLQITFKNIFGLDNNFAYNIMFAYRKDVFDSQQLDIRQHKLIVPVFLSYSINTSVKVKPVISFGFTNSLNLSFEISDPIMKRYLSNYSIGGLLGIGAELKRGKLIYTFNIFSVYEPLGISSSTFTTNNYFSSQIFHYFALFGVKKDFY